MSSQRRSIPTADRISTLPDEILCHILSFLPTKLAAATSVLSKRWKPVRLSVLALDFDDQTFEDFSCFNNFLYSAMRSRDIRLPIRSFSLKCGSSSFCNPRDVSLFVCDGNGKFHLPINLPPSILTFRALEVLKLKNLTVNYLSQVDFPRLKTLHLDRVYFRRHGYILKLLSGCPILEDLQTKSLRVVNREKKPVPEENFKALPNLVKARVYNLYIPINLVCKAEILHLELLWTTD